MNAIEMHSTEAGLLASPGAPKKNKVTGHRPWLFIAFDVLNLVLMIISGCIVYKVIFKIGLIPDATVEFLLGVSSWPAFFVVYIFFDVTVYALVGIARMSAKSMMKYKGTLLVALVFTTVSLISPSIGFHYKLKSGFESGIAKGMSGFDVNASNAYNAYALQLTQVKYDCCGWNGPQDFQAILNGSNVTMDKTHVPVSCCKNDGFTETGPFATCLLADATRQGCRRSDAYLFANYLKVAFITELVLLILLLSMTCMALFRAMA